ncbi:glucan biosynthesis protein G [Amantichitinum ursilacus]|uniref:Glucans biosynthesis protein G n=1 Tax=Amantichitinum ursilacus TaxID=857265 RepID=A0A0N0XKT0_9NEIS|nr:glucan biosynthesis protein G [Amantichitinum ursilacus]KPC55043.1 Glucans biosynthesis protein G precursor [Amantichitinum ursilacus]
MKPHLLNTATLLAAVALTSTGAYALDFNTIAAQAQALANKSYQKPEAIPDSLKQLDYDQLRDIRWNPNNNYWKKEKLPFEMAFFHLGRYFDAPVHINEVVGNQVKPIHFDPALFDYGKNKLDTKALKDVGFAGFRLHYPINTPAYKDEVISFLGASYFRAVGKGQHYGLSARGLAVDTGAQSGEEFPRFKEFWLVRPAAKDKQIVVYALLDSPRVTGAYRFVLKPDVSTTMDVTARIYTRDKIDKVGIAPLTSMFFFGANQHAKYEDYRPQVHDSEGLSVAAGNGEWIWRPLTNPTRLSVTSFATTDPKGFGLMQRSRGFDQYEDLEARYEQRPSAWIEPQGKWGAGRVELVQIPEGDETNDNIVAYWVPAKPLEPKKAFDFSYRLSWQKNVETHPPLAWVAQTRQGRGYMNKPDDNLEYAVDFNGPTLAKLQGEPQPDVSVDANGQLLEKRVFKNDVSNGWRLVMRIKRIDPAKPIELRAALKSNNQVATETWSYLVPGQ